MNTIDLESLSLVRGGDGQQPTPQEICGPNGVKSVESDGFNIDLPGRFPNVNLGPLHVNFPGGGSGSHNRVECYPQPCRPL